MTITLKDIEAAAALIEGRVVKTPLLPSRTLSDMTGAHVSLKFENLQFTSSFKERGAIVKLESLGPAERKRGVIAASAGNHAQGVAYHAQMLNIPATIVMPATTPHVKVKHTAAFGAEVVLTGETLADAKDEADKIGAEKGLVWVHPYDDEKIIAGQGTVGLEMLDAAPDLNAIIAPIGGGGLISGIAIAAKAKNPAIEIFGVQADLYPAMHSVMSGADAPKEIGGGQTIAEGIAVKRPGEITKPIVKKHVADIFLVGEAQIEHAINLLMMIEKTVIEGAGAASLAALIANKDRFAGKRVGLVLSGGNIDARILSYVLLRELAREGRILTIHIESQDRPGYLGMITTLIGDAGGNIIDVTHNRLFTALPAKAADIGLTIETRDAQHADAIMKELEAKGLNIRRVIEAPGHVDL
jgi:threonine dehydratase